MSIKIDVSIRVYVGGIDGAQKYHWKTGLGRIGYRNAISCTNRPMYRMG